MSIFLTTLAGSLYVVGYVPYIRGILRGASRPSKTSWLIWAILDIITVIEMFAKSVLNGQMIGVALGSGIVTVLAFMHGSSAWKKLDVACLGGAIIGLFLWYASGNATIGIVISSTIMFIGCIPTFESAWKNPVHENRTGWTLYFVSCILQLFAIPEWSTAAIIQPISFAISETIMMFLLWIKPRITNRSIETRS